MPRAILLPAVAVVLLAATCTGESLSPDLKTKVEAQVKALESWSTDTKLVEAVKAYNAGAAADAKAMTNDKWRTLTVLDSFVRSLSRNELATYLKSRRDPAFAEVFVSGADGGKVAFLYKPSNWSHSGTDQHQFPMKGKTWIGDLGIDAPSGEECVQVALPVLDGRKPIGSVVIGLRVSKLR